MGLAPLLASQFLAYVVPIFPALGVSSPRSSFYSSVLFSFCWVSNVDRNPHKTTMFLDDVFFLVVCSHCLGYRLNISCYRGLWCRCIQRFEVVSNQRDICGVCKAAWSISLRKSISAIILAYPQNARYKLEFRFFHILNMLVCTYFKYGFFLKSYKFFRKSFFKFYQTSFCTNLLTFLFLRLAHFRRFISVLISFLLYIYSWDKVVCDSFFISYMFDV